MVLSNLVLTIAGWVNFNSIGSNFALIGQKHNKHITLGEEKISQAYLVKSKCGFETKVLDHQTLLVQELNHMVWASPKDLKPGHCLILDHSALRTPLDWDFELDFQLSDGYPTVRLIGDNLEMLQLNLLSNHIVTQAIDNNLYVNWTSWFNLCNLIKDKRTSLLSKWCKDNDRETSTNYSEFKTEVASVTLVQALERPLLNSSLPYFNCNGLVMKNSRY